MSTNPERSLSSEATSPSFRPIRQDGRGAVDSFDPDEFLYRRYALVHFADGQVLPQSISFPKPSFNRSKFSRPEDVLHVDCCGGKELPGCGVLESGCLTSASLRNRAINVGLHLYPKHVPNPTCYAHSELWCSSPSSEDTKPTRKLQGEASDITVKGVEGEDSRDRVKWRLAGLLFLRTSFGSEAGFKAVRLPQR